ncbi:MAG: hypothetical protein JO007_08480 [Alphaproteobacteria bacterium]|nr:hypothetical protein [Alphaproteobacteria bacterium]
MKSADALDLIMMLPLMAVERPQSDVGRAFHPNFPHAGSAVLQAMSGLKQFACASFPAEDERR